MDPPMAMTTADNNDADNTGENALLPHVLFKPTLESPFNKHKKGNWESLGQLHKSNVVHAGSTVNLDVNRSPGTEKPTSDVYFD